MNMETGYRRAIGWISIVLAVGVLVSCASSPKTGPTASETTAQWNAAVDKQIHDAQRAGNMKQYGQQLSDLKRSLSQDIAALDEKALELNSNYASNRDEARQMVADFMQKRDAALAQYRDIIFAMRREVTAAEWKSLND
jgi:hypothetical protein